MCDLDHAKTGSSNSSHTNQYSSSQHYELQAPASSGRQCIEQCNSMQRLVTAPEFAAFCAAKTDAVEVTVDGAEGDEDQELVEAGGESSSSSEL
jgi:hypothetical protein